MLIRKDGEETRQKILDAACHVFGEKGYRGATHAAICDRAGVNTAAINYHFGSKSSLYRAVWDHIVQRVERLYPTDGGIAPDANATDRLSATVRALLERRTDQRSLRPFHNIRMMEMANPSGILDEAMTRWREKVRAHVVGILKSLLGPEATLREIELCEMSIVSQCLMAHGHPRRGSHRPPWHAATADLDVLVAHILRFSLAGINAVRQSIDDRGASH